jgi:hypothetical protein
VLKVIVKGLARAAALGGALWAIGGAAITAGTLVWVGTCDRHPTQPTGTRRRRSSQEQWDDVRLRSAWDTPECLLCDG